MPLVLTSFPIFSMISILMNKTHLLSILLLLEFFILMTMIQLIAITNLMAENLMMISMFILSITACEAALGLSTLVIISRNLGNDLINTHNLTKW